MITKERIILLGILAIIGTGMVLAAYFIENISNNEKPGQAEDNDIAIILKPNQEVQENGCEETDACAVEYEGVPEKTDELKSSELKVYATGGGGANATKEETAEISESAGFGEVEGGQGTYTGDTGNLRSPGGSNEDGSAAEPESVMMPPMPPTPIYPEQQNATTQNSLNVLVVQNNQVVSNETVDLDEG